jgi:hypothetical protein
MLSQANALVEKLMASVCVHFRKSSLSVVINLLAETAKENAEADAADRTLAHSFIQVLLRQAGRSNWENRHPQLSHRQRIDDIGKKPSHLYQSQILMRF